MDRLKLWPSQAHLRASDADRERVSDELTRHCAEGRLTSEELSERVDVALRARTLGELAGLKRDLPRLPAPAAPRRPRWRLWALLAAGLAAVVLAALGAGFVALLLEDPLGATLAALLVVVLIVVALAALGSVLVTLAPFVALGLAARWVGRRVGEALEAGGSRPRIGA